MKWLLLVWIQAVSKPFQTFPLAHFHPEVPPGPFVITQALPKINLPSAAVWVGLGKPLEDCNFLPVSDKRSSSCSMEHRSRTGAPGSSQLLVGVCQGATGMVSAAAALSTHLSLSLLPH